MGKNEEDYDRMMKKDKEDYDRMPDTIFREMAFMAAIVGTAKSSGMGRSLVKNAFDIADESVAERKRRYGKSA